MKKIVLAPIFVWLFSLAIFAQSNVSAPRDFFIQREIKPAQLTIVPGTLQFVDQDKNDTINANEKCLIRFLVKNEGKGDGFACVARTIFSGNTQGISIADVKLPTIPSKSEQWVEIPIVSNSSTQTGAIALNIVVDELNGGGTDVINHTIPTYKLKTPMLEVISQSVTSNSNNIIKGKPFKVQFTIKNTDEGIAENVRVSLKLPQTFTQQSGQEIYSIPQLYPGETLVCTYELKGNKASLNKEQIQIVLSEKQGKYAKASSIPVLFTELPAILKLLDGSFEFVDANNNDAIDANEKCEIRFKIQNIGSGEGEGCFASVKTSGTTQDIQIFSSNLSTIAPGAEHLVKIPITAGNNTAEGNLALNIVVTEPHGFGTDTLSYSISTRKLRTPDLKVVSHIVNSQSGQLKKKEPFSVKVLVQNKGQGVAENVQISLNIPSSLFMQDGQSHTINELQPGATYECTYELIAQAQAQDEEQIQIELKEKLGQYAEGTSIPLIFDTYIASNKSMNITTSAQDVEIKQASLISDVDENIPVTDTTNANTFVVIIANENYEYVDPVAFALNDGMIFREYCLKTLGIPERHIQYIPNATLNVIKTKVTWLQNLCGVFENAQIIFYYAGHGIPDENSKTAYLLPVDGTGMDVSTGYKLDDLYATLGNIPSKNVTVFMDACFSGSKRAEEGMIASARGVAIKAKSGVPQGNMVVFSAAQGDETAYPNYDKKHGMFTYFLLKKLQETAGDVNLHELGTYIIEQVQQQSVLLNEKLQTPCVTPSATLGDEWKTWKLL